MTIAPQGIERLRYWQGQTLGSRDVNDQLRMDASLLWWHNRAIHDAYGEIWGFEPELEGTHVLVQAGLAYDCFGRELVLSRPIRLAVPDPDTDVSGWWLVLRATSGIPSPRPLVELLWLPVGPVFNPRAGVSLGRLVVAKDGFVLQTELCRRSTQAFARPRLGNGQTVHGKTNWRPLSLRLSRYRKLPIIGVEVEIDTSAAGFQQTPCYFAWLRGDPFRQALLERGIRFVAFDHVERATSSRFLYSLWLAFSPRHFRSDGFSTLAVSLDAPVGIVEFARREISVCWLGIEAVPTSRS